MQLKLVAIFILTAILPGPDTGVLAQISHTYRATLQTPGGELPFGLELKISSDSKSGIYTIVNGPEQISNTFSIPDNDSLHLNFPVFNTELVLLLKNTQEEIITGIWYDHSRIGNYYLPFNAELNKKYRFIENPLPPKQNISGRWETIFSSESGSENTVGIFKQEGNHLSGTFLTTTGDYRFLEGEVSADSFFLSAFDGSHAFLFKGKIQDDGNLTGGWWSGNHYSAKFVATRNENAQLPDPKSLTFLKPGYNKIAFAFPDENGNLISLEDEQFKNKVIIIQITGSWCPNCMDETSYLSEVEDKYKNKDLAIIALSFERQPDPKNFRENIEKERHHFGVSYTFLNAGLPKNASEALPMLNNVMGFPTTIILNKKQEVVEIYTGFSGPATGEIFLEFQKGFESLLDSLLQ